MSDVLFHQHMHLVEAPARWMAGRYPRLNEEDIRQQALLGLLVATRKGRALPVDLFVEYAGRLIFGYMRALLWRGQTLRMHVTDDPFILDSVSVDPRALEREPGISREAAWVEEAIARLPAERSGRRSLRAEVLRARFGIGQEVEERVALAKRLGISRQRVQQIENLALADMRWLLKARRWREGARAREERAAAG